jgi:hypothetical protein
LMQDRRLHSPKTSTTSYLRFSLLLQARRLRAEVERELEGLHNVGDVTVAPLKTSDDNFSWLVIFPCLSYVVAFQLTSTTARASAKIVNNVLQGDLSLILDASEDWNASLNARVWLERLEGDHLKHFRLTHCFPLSCLKPAAQLRLLHLLLPMCDICVSDVISDVGIVLPNRIVVVVALVCLSAYWSLAVMLTVVNLYIYTKT